MDHGRLFSAGVIGGVAFSVLSAVLRAAGIHIDVELWLGTIVIGPGSAAWLVGFFWHLTFSGFLAIVYGRVFVALDTSTPKTGLRVALVHTAIGGLLLGALPFLHPRMPEIVPAPGVFASAYGVAAVAAFVAVHLAYGAVVGALAHAVRLPIPARRRSPAFRTSSPPRAREIAARRSAEA